MKIIIIGGGNIVYFLGRMFSSKGYTVVVINRHSEECTQLARKLKSTIIHGDGSDPVILEEAGAYMADVVLAVTSRDQKNLIICQLAKIKFQVPRAMALVDDPDNEDVFQKLGIQAISPSRILSGMIEEKAGLDDIVNLFPLGEGKINITELILHQDSKVIEKSLMEILLPENSLIATILRGENVIIPRGSTLLQENDKLILITTPENHARVVKTLTGEEI
ncbi:NAD-binding protein [candidate division KSB1 bacterium]|nr:NAD-binding protein [candidate division KSB1 bacterium]